jgi:hypothetical protein
MNSPKIPIQPPRAPSPPEASLRQRSSTDLTAPSNALVVTPFRIWLGGSIAWVLIDGYGYISSPDRAAHSFSDWTWVLLDFSVPPLVGLGFLWLHSQSQPRKELKPPPVVGASAINLLRWRREHQVALIVACVLGAAVAMLYGFSHSQFGMPGAGMGVHFLFWLQHPEFYWHWALSGSIIAGLALYLVRLLKA